MPDNTNTANIDGQGNIIIQDVNGSTINIGRGSDPETLERLKELQIQGLELGEGITDIQDLVEQSIELLLKRLPPRITVKEIPALLRNGSRKFYQEVRAAKGRFGHIQEIEEALFCRLKLKLKLTEQEEKTKSSGKLEQITRGRALLDRVGALLRRR